MGDRPTPRSIAVCALIALRSDPSSPLHEIEFNPHLYDNMTMFLENSVFYSVASLPTWMKELGGSVGVEVKELILDTLNMASESVDSLVDLMDSLRAAVIEGLVDAVSVHGVYLRQVCLGFEQLSFESVTFLWQEFCSQLDNVNAVEASQQGDANKQNWPLSHTQVEELMQQTCRQLDLAHYSFERVELQVRTMLEEAPETSAAYFLRFLNCLRHKDRSALDALHQFFDHAMIQKKKSTKEVIQFSAILLTLLHESFGDSALALMATQEAVRVAQQSKDPTCVAFSLGKLFQNDGNGLTGRREILKRCVARATQDQIRSLVLGASLCLSLDHLEDQTRDPHIIWRQLMESNSEPMADRIPSLDRPTCLLSSPKETIEGLRRQMVVEAGIWGSLGVPVLSCLASMVTLDCYQRSSVEETLLALSNRDRLSDYGNPSRLLSERNSNQGDSLNFAGTHDVDMFLFNGSLIPHQLYQLQEQSLKEDNLDTAHLLEIMLHSSLPPGTALRSQFSVDICMGTCYRLYRSQNRFLARALAMNLLQSPQVDTVHRIKVQLLLAAMELESRSNCYVSALPHLLEAISICEHSSMHNLHAVALLILARVLLRMRKSKRALSVVKTAIAALLANGHVSHQAEAYLTQAKCFIQLAATTTQCSALSLLNRRRYESAFQGLKASECLFKQCHDKHHLREVYYLRARILFLLGHIEECQIASNEFMISVASKSSKPYLWDSLFVGNVGITV